MKYIKKIVRLSSSEFLIKIQFETSDSREKSILMKALTASYSEEEKAFLDSEIEKATYPYSVIDIVDFGNKIGYFEFKAINF